MSVNFETESARQIATAPHALISQPAFSPIAAHVTDAAKDLLDAPRTVPLDRIGLACLAWAGVFTVLATVLVLTLK
jgi:hypothetical protein